MSTSISDLVESLNRHADALDRFRDEPDPIARVRLVAASLRATAGQLDRSDRANLPARNEPERRPA